MIVGLIVCLGLIAYAALVWVVLSSLDDGETVRRYAELKRREKDPALWNAQRMSIVAEKAPELHAEIVRYNDIKAGKL